MHSKVLSCLIRGIDCEKIEIEVDIAPGLPLFSIVGLGDASVQEAKERVRSAIKNSGFDFPQTRKTVNLAPAILKKHGSAYDVPIAIGLLRACGVLPWTGSGGETGEDNFWQKSLFVGELALDGGSRPIEGAVVVASFARERGFERLFLPRENWQEAAIIEGIEIVPFSGLKDLVETVKFGENAKIEADKLPSFRLPQKESIPSAPEFFREDPFRNIKGQELAKRALILAAGGRHNVLFTGPPGSGKTSLAKAFREILPPMSIKEAIEVTKIYSVSSQNSRDKGLIATRPFRTVHHSASAVSLIGGGKNCLPGEISLAHNGVLFLDEMAEFPSRVLESLRQPMEDREINISRAFGSFNYPADFVLIGTMNPCPCGFYGDPEKQCKCSLKQVLSYQSRISGPLLDRIDIFLNLPRVEFDQLSNGDEGESSAENLLQTVKKLAAVQSRRSSGKPFYNSRMSHKEIKKFCQIDEKSLGLFKKAAKVMQLSPRGYQRTLKLARTIADLAESESIQGTHIMEALQFRAPLSLQT